MRRTSYLNRMAATVVLLALGPGVASAETAKHKARGQDHQSTVAPSPAKKVDRSGRKRVGEASYYARRFAGRKMADGTPMKPQGDNAASKTLPLGTKAKVTNLETGQSADVTIRDRGPYVPGRIIDLSPSTARDIGITRKDGVAPVEVKPIAVPPPEASARPQEKD